MYDVGSLWPVKQSEILGFALVTAGRKILIDNIVVVTLYLDLLLYMRLFMTGLISPFIILNESKQQAALWCASYRIWEGLSLVMMVDRRHEQSL